MLLERLGLTGRGAVVHLRAPRAAEDTGFVQFVKFAAHLGERWPGHLLISLDLARELAAEDDSAAWNAVEQLSWIRSERFAWTSEAGVLDRVPKRSLDFVYLDCGEGVRFERELQLWWKKVKPVGLLCGHQVGAQDGAAVAHAPAGRTTAIHTIPGMDHPLLPWIAVKPERE